jgi:hypothetical protein
VRVYTAVQLFEVAVFTAVVSYGVFGHHPSLVALGTGLLIGKAVMNILTPEGGSVLRRSIVGYGVGAVFVVFAVAAIQYVKS